VAYLVSLFDSRGEELCLDYPNARFKEFDGMGMPPVVHMEEDYAQQVGTTYHGSAIRKRFVPLRWDIFADTEAAMWEARDELLRLVSVLELGFKLRLTLPNGAVRQIDLRYDSQLTLPRNLEQNDNQQVFLVNCGANNPLLYDPTAVLWAYSVSGGAGEFGWETDGLAFPAAFGGSIAEGVPESKTYSGSWAAYPVITLRGPMTKPVITNHGVRYLGPGGIMLTADLVLEFVDGYTIDDGDSVVIDLSLDDRARRELTVTHSVDGNAPDALTNDSDLGEWRIERHPYAIDGINSISVAFTGGNANSRCEIRFNTQYVGC